MSVDLRSGLRPRHSHGDLPRRLADGHPVSGGFSFGVGTPATAGPGRGAPDVAELLERSSAGPLVEGLYGLARGVHYAALLLVVGALGFRLFVWRGGGRRWPGRLLVLAAAVGLVAALGGTVLQAALAAGRRGPPAGARH